MVVATARVGRGTVCAIDGALGTLTRDADSDRA